MQFHHLDPRTHALMFDEVQYDIARNQLFLSVRLSNGGRLAYVLVLLDAIERGNPGTFATEIARRRLLNSHEESHRRGVPYIKAVPRDAHISLAEGEYNRFYLRGLCVRAVEDGIDHLEIYRAKVVYSPRWDSEVRIGKLIGAAALLNDLRTHIGVDVALGVPNGVNSGLSAKLPANSNIAP